MSAADLIYDSRRRMGRFLLAGFVLATCVRVWVGPQDLLPQAAAQIPDSGLQRKQMVDELVRTNQLLEEIIHILKTQRIRVSFSSTGKSRDGAAVPIPPGT